MHYVTCTMSPRGADLFWCCCTAGRRPGIPGMASCRDSQNASRLSLPIFAESATERTPDGYDKKTIAADIAALIEHLGVGKVCVAGHDMGGKAAYVLSHTRPDLLSKLVLVDCLLPGTENMDPAKGGAWHYGFHMAAEFPEMLTAGRERGVYRGADQDMVASEGRDQRCDHRRICAAFATPGGMTAGFNYYRALRTDIEPAQQEDRRPGAHHCRTLWRRREASCRCRQGSRRRSRRHCRERGAFRCRGGSRVLLRANRALLHRLASLQ
jgi:pimeloyl-ACP methyl ester carboxylesterase